MTYKLLNIIGRIMAGIFAGLLAATSISLIYASGLLLWEGQYFGFIVLLHFCLCSVWSVVFSSILALSGLQGLRQKLIINF
jgi:hypothetical protein